MSQNHSKMRVHRKWIYKNKNYVRFSSDKICNLLLQSSVVNLHFSKHTIICTHFRLYFKNCKKFQAITYSSSETPPDICFPQWYISTLSCSSNQQQAAWDLIWALNTLLSSVITYRNILLSTQVTFSRLTNRTLTHMYIHNTHFNLANHIIDMLVR